MREVEIYNITVSTLDFTFKEADTEDGRLRRILNFSHTLDWIYRPVRAENKTNKQKTQNTVHRTKDQKK